MNKKAFSAVAFLVCLSVMSCAALAQQPRRATRSGGLDNLSLPSTGVSLSSASWQQFAPEGAGFSVMMPGLPEEKSRDLGQGQVAMHMYRVKADDMDYVAGAVLNLPGELAQMPGFAAKYFQVLPSIMIKSAENVSKNYRLASERSISINDSPGRQYKFDSPEYTCTVRVYLVGRNIYLLAVESQKASVSTDNVEKFLSSFTVKED